MIPVAMWHKDDFSWGGVQEEGGKGNKIDSSGERLPATRVTNQSRRPE